MVRLIKFIRATKFNLLTGSEVCISIKPNCGVFQYVIVGSSACRYCAYNQWIDLTSNIVACTATLDNAEDDYIAKKACNL